MTIQIAFLGAGRVIEHHVKFLKEMPEYQIVAFCDMQEARGEVLRGYVDVPWYDNYHVMLRNHPEVQLVVIATPSGMHHEHAMDVLSQYKKNILVEKPTFLHPHHYAEANQFAVDHGLKLFPVYQNRYNKAVQRLKQGIDSGELGKVRMANVRLRWCRPQRYYDRDPWRGTWSHDGGALTNQGVHYLDLFRYLGGEVVRVNSRLKTFGVDIEVENAAVATCEFADGGLGVVEITTAAVPDDYEASVSFVCEKGLAHLGGWATNELQSYSPNPSACEESSVEISHPYGLGHHDTYLDVHKALKGEKEYPIQYEDALNTLCLLHALYRSDEVGDWVDVSTDTVSERFGRVSEEISNIYRTVDPTQSNRQAS